MSAAVADATISAAHKTWIFKIKMEENNEIFLYKESYRSFEVTPTSCDDYQPY